MARGDPEAARGGGAGRRRVDPRSLRFGAGASCGLLAAALLLDLLLVPVVMGANLVVAAAFGVMLYLPDRPWPFLRRGFHVRGVPRVDEVPARFSAATLGLALLLGALALGRGHALLGWGIVAGVAALQGAHATTGIDLIARLHAAGGAVPDAFSAGCRRLDRMRVPPSWRGRAR